MYFGLKTTDWYEINQRELPWRETNDPYLIWLSEVILQQTRVNQGISYYYAFIENFPTIFHLANSPIDKVLKVWQGLGYYSRARSLHHSAKFICDNYNGVFPNNFSELLKLKGIGPYTAAAIASIAFNEPVPAVDGNVHRVLSRYFGLHQPAGSQSAIKECMNIGTELIKGYNPGKFNQSVIELGALVCTPKQPKCTECPLNEDCFALKNNMVNDLPVKKEKVKVKLRYFHYLHIKCKGQTAIKKRSDNDIWKELFEFPLIETNQNIDYVEFIEQELWKSILPDTPEKLLFAGEFKHILTHQHIEAKFYTIEISHWPSSFPFLIIEDNKLQAYAVSRLTEKYLQNKG
jgi:A/G-specific adenine glycosylase